MTQEQKQLIQELQIMMGFDKIGGETWVLESPDGGKTVTKRKPGTTSEKFMLENISGRWHSMDELRVQARRNDREQDLRQQFPALQEAHDVYQSLLLLADPNIDNKQEK